MACSGHNEGQEGAAAGYTHMRARREGWGHIPPQTLHRWYLCACLFLLMPKLIVLVDIFYQKIWLIMQRTRAYTATPAPNSILGRKVSTLTEAGLGTRKVERRPATESPDPAYCLRRHCGWRRNEQPHGQPVPRRLFPFPFYASRAQDQRRSQELLTPRANRKGKKNLHENDPSFKGKSYQFCFFCSSCPPVKYNNL
jgi:hypothetical protein